MHTTDSGPGSPAGRPSSVARPEGQSGEVNRILRALPPEEYAWVAERLDTVDIALDDVLAEPERPWQHVYFPETAIASVVNELESGGIIEAGTIGREGMAGLQDGDIISYRRGKVRVRDREGLERAACECYGIVRRHFDRLLP